MINTICTKKIVNSLLKTNKLYDKKVDIVTIATFTKLLDISIVASNLSAFLRRIKTSLLPFFLSFSLFEGVSEKKATSDPDINADSIKSINIIIVKILFSNVKKSEFIIESGSKILKLKFVF